MNDIKERLRKLGLASPEAIDRLIAKDYSVLKWEPRWLPAETFCDRYGVGPQTLRTNRHNWKHRPEQPIKLADYRHELLVDETFFLTASTVRSMIVSYNHRLLYELEEKGFAPVEIAVEISKLCGENGWHNWEVWISTRCWNNSPTGRSILDYRIPVYHLRFYKHSEKLKKILEEGNGYRAYSRGKRKSLRKIQ